MVQWNGSPLATTWASTSQMTAAVPAANTATAGIFPVTVYTPAPGGGTSSAISFTVNNPVPATLSPLSPTSAIVGTAPFTLTVNGSNFVNGSSVQWNGYALATTYVSATQLTATVPATDCTTAGTTSVTVFNDTPGGGTSNAQTFTCSNPVPATTSPLSPASAVIGTAPFTVTVNGSNFVNGSSVQWNGSALATTYVSATQLTATVPATDCTTTGTASVTVFNTTPGGGTSNAQTFTCNNPVPATTSPLSPASAIVGAAPFMLTVNGSNIVNGSTVEWNGSALTTNYVSATKLTATVPATDCTTAGTASVTVFNSTPGGGTSNAQTFACNNPVPATVSLSPAGAQAGGGAFTLIVNGSNFVSTSTVNWNGSGRVTTFVSASELKAAITSTDISSAGAVPVTVSNPTPGGGISSPPLAFNVYTLAGLTAPTPGSTLTGSSAAFTWSTGVGVTKYQFRLGTTGAGSTDLYNSAEASTTALTTGTISNIPTYGATLYARLYSLINGTWQYND